MNELDQALQRLQDAERVATAAGERSAALLEDFRDRMRRHGVAPIPVGDYKDLGATGWIGHRRAASFSQRELGWVLPQKRGGMMVTADGRLLQGQRLYVMGPGQKKTNGDPYISFHSPPKDGFAFCVSSEKPGWFTGNSWMFTEFPDATLYVDHLAAALATMFSNKPISP
ncbi:hypothetical protein [Arthrobacter sp. TE12232]